MRGCVLSFHRQRQYLTLRFTISWYAKVDKKLFIFLIERHPVFFFRITFSGPRNFLMEGLYLSDPPKYVIILGRDSNYSDS